MPDPDSRFIEIGRIGRPHGLNGTVRFQPNEYFQSGLFERLSIFYMRNERADLIPVRLKEFQISGSNNRTTFFVKFDMIADRKAAEAAMNKALFSTRDEVGELPVPEAGDDDDLTGFTVFQDGEEIGEILVVMENPAHPILEVKFGSTTILIPYVDEYIEQTDHDEAAIHCRNLDHFTDDLQ